VTSRIIAVGNLKGGTGKSTVAVNLACRLAESQSVTLVDADPQGTAAAWLQNGRAAGMPRSLAVVARPLEASADANAWQQEVRAHRRSAARIVVDLPPQKGLASQAALQIADLLIAPVTPSGVDLHATAQALAVLHRVRAARNGRPACLLVPSKVDRRLAQGRKAGALLEQLGCEVGTALAQRAAHVEAFNAAAWIGAHAPDSPAHADICALAAEVEDRLDRCLAPEAVPMAAPIDAAMPQTLADANGALGIAAGLLSFVTVLRPGLRRAEQLASFLRFRPSASLRQP
jgi:chromosome partitioning protein